MEKKKGILRERLIRGIGGDVYRARLSTIAIGEFITIPKFPVSLLLDHYRQSVVTYSS